MGVNMVGFAIVDNDAAIEASQQEIIRRYYQTDVYKRQGKRFVCAGFMQFWGRHQATD